MILEATGPDRLHATNPSDALPLMPLDDFLISVSLHYIGSQFGVSRLLTNSETKKGDNQRITSIHWQPADFQHFLQIIPHTSGLNPTAVTLPSNFTSLDTRISATSAIDLTVPGICITIFLFSGHRLSLTGLLITSSLRVVIDQRNVTVHGNYKFISPACFSDMVLLPLRSTSKHCVPLQPSLSLQMYPTCAKTYAYGNSSGSYEVADSTNRIGREQNLSFSCKGIRSSQNFGKKRIKRINKHKKCYLLFLL